jgi:transposase
MDLPATTLGIDIAKLKFDVCLIKPNGKAKHKVFQNTRHGFEQLISWLASHKTADCRACLEATGTYGEPLALFLYEAGFVVSLVNPAAVRAKALAGLSRTKNDKVDAELIARFCLAQQPAIWQPPAPELRNCKLWFVGSTR